MRRAVTFSLVVLTVFLWAASLWRLSARVTGMDLVYAGIPAGLAPVSYTHLTLPTT